jgi:hypothetical protein
LPGSPEPGARRRLGLPIEIAAVWLLYAVVGAEILVTYARLDPGELYNVSRSGIAGGASRLVVFLNFPVALVAIAVLLLLLERLGGQLKAAAVAGIALSAAVFWPGVVDPGDLDAKPVNAVAAVGVGLAVVVTLLVRRRGRTEALDRTAGRLRLAIAVIALGLAVPWLVAEPGGSLSGVPVLGTLFQTDELRTQPGDPVPHPAVHYGHHHGMDGVTLLWTALLLLPVAVALGARWSRIAATGYLALMLCYGAAILANDVWLEQVVKRGWTDWEVPSVLEPGPTAAWGVLLLASAVLWAVLLALAGRDRPSPPPRDALDPGASGVGV